VRYDDVAFSRYFIFLAPVVRNPVNPGLLPAFRPMLPRSVDVAANRDVAACRRSSAAGTRGGPFRPFSWSTRCTRPKRQVDCSWVFGRPSTSNKEEIRTWGQRGIGPGPRSSPLSPVDAIVNRTDEIRRGWEFQEDVYVFLGRGLAVDTRLAADPSREPVLCGE